MPRTLTAAALAILTATALPATAQSVIETDQMVVYEGQWVQTKLPELQGALLFLTVPRGQKGEYFSVTCGAGGDRMVKLGFLSPLPGNTVDLTIDGTARTLPVVATGTTLDQTYTKSQIHRYEVAFPSPADRQALFAAMRRGSSLQVQGQTIPVSLKGATAALNGQSQYCS